MLRSIIFDHDGTLVDSEKQHLRAWNLLLEEYGHFLPEEDYVRHHSGIPTVGSAERLIKLFGLPLEPEHFCHQKQLKVQSFTDVPPLMPGVRELVTQLRKQMLPMAVASGSRFPEVERNLRNHDLYDHFDAVCTGCQVERNKPAPDVYLLAAEKLELQPEQCLAVEDTPTGLQSALAAGMQCVVIPGPGFDQAMFAGATQVLDSFMALSEWLSSSMLTDHKNPAGVQ